MFKFDLGLELKDTITGFQGVAMARTEYLTGCNHYGLQSRDQRKDGQPIDWVYFNESRLTVVDQVADKSDGAPSGPCSNPPQQ